MGISDVLQTDLHDMLDALGLPTGARPQSPHEVFRECIEEVKRLRAREPKDIAERLDIAMTTMGDARELLRRHYLSHAPQS